ncbi:PREDICTED: myosin-G heavy chain isoform X2 [Bactrocera latifrons]|uniref:myosin-G heavy chain isoform X2 n=1 Tax=Bactrocera latifrons TaxID=174628 RepID=UPI0008DE0260|nr:PREDICTED: myosin-G heavy chain isoform X2 [Bactrocera latifrons]XP_018785880.1 PREDICTED: myosin-G heavy chain isoform X2 [Bactrocera latifrons]XP_018785881.1 PREDICTED: myosin-G heavy chain isoform X2 [Bactrocera latifrons]XP_018785882.1 PREDICTED: myosin-G heavy chain isoform X2 [Bactrocera latifrons]
MATLGLSKVFILDKYFTELQKFWETEKKLQDASSSNEAVHLQQRLKSLSTELVTLRNRLHVGQGQQNNNNSNNNNNNNSNNNNSHSNTSNCNVTTVSNLQQHQQQQQQHVNNTAGLNGLNLHASTTNLHNSTQHLNNSSTTTTNCINNNSLQQHQHQQQQQQLQLTHSTLIPTHGSNSSNNNNNAINKSNSGNCNSNSNNNNSNTNNNVSLTSCNNVNSTNTAFTHINSNHSNNNNNKSHLHSFNHTLPHNSTISAGNTATLPSGAAAGIVSTRNTSIPHPLPSTIQQQQQQQQHHQQQQSHHQHHQQQQHQQQHNAHTLPMRSSASIGAHVHHLSHHNLPPFIPIAQKHASASHGSSFSNIVAPFGYSNTNVEQRNVSNNFLGSLQTHHSVAGHNNNSVGNGGAHKQPREIEDLIHLPGPLTEDAVMRTLQARFNDNCYFTNVGPILLSINPYRDVGNPLTLTSTRSLPLAPQLNKIVQEAVRQQTETGYPQAIILSGTSGAGKTHCSMLLLRQLFAVAGGGPETDAFKHLAAAFTVLRSLGSAKTTTNSESSRIGQFIEVQVTDGALYRTKIHCYFLDQTRVIRPLPKEKNYHIFYQMLAGLSREERIKLNLEGYSPANLRYLQSGDILQNEQEDAARFQAWKTCLGILGIPFLDVVRVLAAVLLLGNVQFIDGQSLEVDVKGEAELNSVASLLGVPPAALFRGLTTRTHNARGQLVKSVCDANMSNMTRDCLAKALYCRTVATIVRRANSLKRLGSTLGTLSSDSNESVHNQADVASQHASTIGGNSGSKSMAALNNAVRHATDGFIGILDMFGFEEPSHAQLEHLCINLCAETMQHFYNTHIFKSSVESCRDEGIVCDAEVDYVDNVPCIDLISSLRTGLLSMLDAECSIRGTAESYVAKIKVQHRNSTRLETKHASEPYDPRMFMIRHFAGRVEYDTTDFLDTNRDVVRDDLVAVFYKHTCNFGFATHLFGSELKALYALQNVPRGLSFRISPTSHTDLLNGDEPVSTLTQDFHTRLDNLLRTLVHARPHFVRCIRSNANETAGCFERKMVVRQIRSLQVLETVNLMASGFPHRMRFKQFNARYVAMLAPFRLHRRSEDKAMEDCNLILEFAMENPPVLDGSVTLAWAPGKRHVFLSEGMRQHLEHLRAEIRTKSATLIQATWRGWQWRKKMGGVKRTRGVNGVITMLPTASSATKLTKLLPNNGANSIPRLSAKSTNLMGTVTRPRPQPIAGTPPPDPNEKCDTKIIQQTCSLFGLDLERPPPVPPSRGYTIAGSLKLSYPQSRIMKMNFPEDPPIVNPAEQQLQQQLKKGEAVSVVGASSCRGHLIVEHKGQSYHVPFQYMELLRPSMPAGNVVVAAGGGGGNGGCGVTNNPNNAASVKNNNNSNNMANKNGSSTGNLTNNCNANNNVGVNNGNSGNTNNNNASNTSAAVKI